ncbi:Anther-specific proline-rich protein APG [Platanthera guangdongensis]|uniref:Anther-specific proline-rich protein APG n=1 Tax=Platanthera guangdongensis TaxID=2320717 RepID=A0ABR2MIF6_9ASPA
MTLRPFCLEAEKEPAHEWRYPNDPDTDIIHQSQHNERLRGVVGRGKPPGHGQLRPTLAGLATARPPGTGRPRSVLHGAVHGMASLERAASALAKAGHGKAVWDRATLASPGRAGRGAVVGGIKEYVPAYLGTKLSAYDLITGVSFASGGCEFDPLTSQLAFGNRQPHHYLFSNRTSLSQTKQSQNRPTPIAGWASLFAEQISFATFENCCLKPCARYPEEECARTLR